MDEREVITDLDTLGRMYPNIFRGTPLLAENLARVKTKIAEVERLSMKAEVGQALLEELIDCMHAVGGLSIMFFEHMEDDVFSRQSVRGSQYECSFSIYQKDPDEE